MRLHCAQIFVLPPNKHIAQACATPPWTGLQLPASPGSLTIERLDCRFGPHIQVGFNCLNLNPAKPGAYLTTAKRAFYLLSSSSIDNSRIQTVTYEASA
jgi:hypothetical protein